MGGPCSGSRLSHRERSAQCQGGVTSRAKAAVSLTSWERCILKTVVHEMSHFSGNVSFFRKYLIFQKMSHFPGNISFSRKCLIFQEISNFSGISESPPWQHMRQDASWLPLGQVLTSNKQNKNISTKNLSKITKHQQKCTKNEKRKTISVPTEAWFVLEVKTKMHARCLFSTTVIISK